jgi:hypothetical protein
MSAWNAILDAIGLRGPVPAPIPVAPKFPGDSDDSAGGQGDDALSAQRWAMAHQIFDFEAEYRNGHLAIIVDPPNDGGIKEVAGITLKYDPQEEPKLEAMINAGKYDAAKQEAIGYIERNTDPVEKWCNLPPIEANLRDIYFNRGPGHSMKILQRSLGVTMDGDFGPITEATEKAAESDPSAFLDDLYHARVWYEATIIGTRLNLDKGLQNRFSQARDFAKTFLT